MKKRILLVTLLVALFVCVFAISASAAEFGTVKTIEGFTTVSGLDTTSRVLMNDGTTYPSAYIFKNTKDISFDALNTATTKNYVATDVVMIEYPEGCTYINRTFAGSTTIEYAFFPNTVTGFQWGTFLSCTELKKAEFADDSIITAINTDAFNNTGIVELKLPNSLQSISDNFMRSCSNLTTVYFGDSFTNGFSNRAVLAGTAIKTIYMPADVFDDEGNALVHTSFFGWNDRDFANTFGKGGVIYYTGTKAQAELIVSTGLEKYKSNYTKEEEYITGMWSTIKLVTPSEYEALSAEQKVATCYMVYDYNRCDAFYYGIHPEKLEEGATDTNSCVLTECSRCGITNKYVGNDNTHIMNTTYGYSNYFANGVIASACQNEGCIYHGEGNAKVDNETLKPIFTSIQYSTKEDSKSFGIYVEYKIDQKAVEGYKAVTGIDLSYGVVAIAKANSSSANPLNVDGSTLANNVVTANVTDSKLSTVKLIITGDWTNNAAVEIYMLGYITNGTELQYVGVQTSEGVKAAATSTSTSTLNAVTYNAIEG